LIAYFLVSASSDSLPLGMQFSIRVSITYDPTPRFLFLSRESEITPSAILRPLVTLILSSEVEGLNRFKISRINGEFLVKLTLSIK
jgi:hypothetical protein